MRLHMHALAAVVALAMPALGQTVSKAVEKPDGPKEKLWLLEASGIGG